MDDLTMEKVYNSIEEAYTECDTEDIGYDDACDYLADILSSEDNESYIK